MITLGLNAVFHDSAAALVVDGVLVAAAEEERFTRVKHAKRRLPFSTWELPFHAIDYCLAEAGLRLSDVDHVAYSFDPWTFAAGRADLPLGDGACLPLPPALTLPSSPEQVRRDALAPWHSPWDPLFLASVLHAPEQLADGAPHHLRKRLRCDAPAHWQWQYVDRHLCHQASAFLAAPLERFKRCAVLTLDDRGERATTRYGVWRDGRYRSLGEVSMPHSLGLLCERVATHLGFLHASDEGKVMALAALGRPRWADAMAAQLRVLGGGQFVLDAIDFSAMCGAPRVPGSALEPHHFDLAASLQQVLERTVLALCGWLREASGERCLAMAGSVALNAALTTRLRDQGPFEALWIQPAAGDAGTALGAALWVDAEARGRAAGAGVRDGAQGQRLAPRVWAMEHAHYGPGYGDDEIEPLLRWAGLAYEEAESEAALAERAAALLADGHLLGWFQGRMEWGPQALGARSIIASPILPTLQQRLNELADRQDFHPVGSAVTAEACAEWFGPVAANDGGSSFRLFTHPVLPHQAARIPSACHSDGSARVQTVAAANNPRFHALLEAFAARTGVAVLANTAFKVRGEPIVCSPKDALAAYHTTPLDALVIGRFILKKPRAEGS